MAHDSKTSDQTRGNGRTGDTGPAPSKPVMQSRGQYAKQGWGSWPNFMHSYQLKTWEPDDVEEGHQILDEFRQSEFEDKMEEYREQLSKKGK